MKRAFDNFVESNHQAERYVVENIAGVILIAMALAILAVFFLRIPLPFL